MANDSTLYVGLDVHKDSITVARVGTGTDEPVVDVATIGTQQYAIDRLIDRLTGQLASLAGGVTTRAERCIA